MQLIAVEATDVHAFPTPEIAVAQGVFNFRFPRTKPPSAAPAPPGAQQTRLFRVAIGQG
jgi:hypothetical protein